MADTNDDHDAHYRDCASRVGDGLYFLPSGETSAKIEDLGGQGGRWMSLAFRDKVRQVRKEIGVEQEDWDSVGRAVGSVYYY